MITVSDMFGWAMFSEAHPLVDDFEPEQCSVHPGWSFDIGDYTTQLYGD